MNRAAASGLLLAVGLLAGAPGCAGECRPVVRDGWIRSGPPSMPMRAGFGTVVNACDAPLEIVGATSPAFADVSLHETTVVDGVSRMRPVPALPVSANGTAELAPGGLHLMLSGPVSALSAGQVVAVDFALRDGTTVRAGFVVR